MATPMKSNARRDLRWAEGLRGITALLIVTSHVFLSMYPHLLSPAPSESQMPSLFQLPVFRLIISGRATLSFFFILTGFVNSLSFHRQVRAGNPGAALSGLAKSSFRRIGRLVLPAAAATIVSWILCQLGAYNLAQRGDVNWFRDISPSPSSSLPRALWDLAVNIFETWSDGANEYDKVQWNLPFLLRASLMTYMALLMTTYVTPRARQYSLLSWYAYGWMSGDILVSMNVSAGILLAELLFDQEDTPSQLLSSHYFKAFRILVMVAGILIAGYPEANAEWSTWSSFLQDMGNKIFCPGTELSRNWGSVGATLIMLGVLYSPTLQHGLSHPILIWMGKVSFAVFLIHSLLLRSVLCWMLFWFSTAPPDTTDEEGNIHMMPLPRVSGVWLVVVIAIFFPIVYICSHLWSTHVEPRCNQISQWVEDRMVDSDVQLQTQRGGIPL